MNLSDITPVVLTRDEEPNIERTLRQLTWAREVVIVDSFSTDATLDLACAFPNVRIVQRSFDTLAAQSNFGLEQVHSKWVLALDADYFVTDEMVRELVSLDPPAGTNAYIGPFIYAVGGRRLRASLYPPRIVLFRRESAVFWQDGHAHRIRVEGNTGTLRAPIVHDDRKSFRRFIERQRRYMQEEADKLRTADPHTLNFASRIRKLIVVAPFAVLLHTLLIQGVILDGWPGLRYAWERFVAELILSRQLLRR